VDLVLLQQALTRMKALVDGAISNSGYTNVANEFKEADNGNLALTRLTKSSQHILPIHEVVKCSIRDELNISHLIYPGIGTLHLPNRSNELKAPMYGQPKNQDVTIVFTEQERGEGSEGLYWNNGKTRVDIDDVEVARRCITVGVRSTLRSIANNINTLSERTGAETLLQRAICRMEESVKGEVYILAAREYNKNSAADQTLQWANHGMIEQYIQSFLGMSDRPTFREEDPYDWHDHVRYERAALIVVDFSQEPPLFYRNLRQMFDDELVTEEFYNQNQQRYDGELSPVDFAEHLVDSHRRQWPDLYPAAENQ
jgi:hypothetical protein